MPTTLMRVGSFTRSVLLRLADVGGGFARRGLEVAESAVASSPDQFAALEAGEIDIAFTSPDNALAYRFLSTNPLGRRLPVVVGAALDRGLGLSLCLAPGRTILDLRGGTVGVDVASSGFAFVAYALLERAGLRPGEYDVVELGSTPRRAEALIEGLCDATVLNAGNELRARRRGATFIGEVSDLGAYLGTVVATLDNADREILELRRQFLNVVLATARDIVAGKHRLEVIVFAREVLGLNEEDAASYHAGLVSPVTGFAREGVVDFASLATVLRLRREYRPDAELDDVEDRWSELVPGALA
jgi:ABC-type nitrate/sulfonate/bicarbonate transport system substrate-binding protein